MNSAEYKYRIENVKKEWAELVTHTERTGYMLTAKEEERMEYLRTLIMRFV